MLLDVNAITPDTILLLDSYFLIVSHRGSTIAAWHKEGYQEQPEHEAFRALLAAPVRDAKASAAERARRQDSSSATREGHRRDFYSPNSIHRPRTTRTRAAARSSSRTTLA